MDGIFIALPVALVIAVAAVLAFIWAARRDQFEDLDTPPMRMLNDDEPVRHEDDARRAGADGAEGTRR
ncbi:MAG: cbb3-type cytochrome oxidase assembly protein CcoS [Phycisphaerales bacterium]